MARQPAAAQNAVPTSRTRKSACDISTERVAMRNWNHALSQVGFLVCTLMFMHPLDAADDARPFGIDQRAAWTTSRLVGSPDPPAPYRVVRRFSKLQFKNPVV